MNSVMIYVCADDFGMSEETCTRIKECAEHGALNSISVFANCRMPNIREYIPEGVSQGAHINLVEGKPLTPPEEISLLVDNRGYFKYSFLEMLMLSVSPKRKEMKRQLYREIKNQIMNWEKNIAPGEKIKIDSHQHIHMIPLVFRTLMQVIEDEKLDVIGIRIPAEPILPYLLTPSLYFTYKPINIIKVFVLKILNLFNKRIFKKSGIKTTLFMGILFSGNMDEKRVGRVLPHYLKIAKKENKDIELLFHPGYVKSGEKVPDDEKKGFIKFYFSKGRRIEFDTLMCLKLD